MEQLKIEVKSSKNDPLKKHIKKKNKNLQQNTLSNKLYAIDRMFSKIEKLQNKKGCQNLTTFQW